MTADINAAAKAKAPRVDQAYWLIGSIVTVTLLPIACLALIALQGNLDDMGHLLATVLPRALQTTALLMSVVAVLTAVFGVMCAWLVTTFEFPFRRTLSWLLVLPIAIPPYIAAYCFVEFLHFAGPVQTFIREIFGFQTRADYWFPEVRSVWGAGFILSLTLYPYVYLATRVVFLMQARNAADVARSLGASNARVFFKVLLPMSRPAIIAGVSLALMETLNDIGASEYLGVRTLTFSIYNTWLGRGSLTGAAQLAVMMLVLVAFVLWLEAYTRRMMRFNAGRSTHMSARPARIHLSGTRSILATLATALPIMAGFGVPVAVLVQFASKRIDQVFEPAFLSALKNSILVGSATAVIVLIVCLALLHFGRLLTGARRFIPRLATVGYTIPGTVLALGLLYVLTSIDAGLNSITRGLFGYSAGLVLSGSAFAIILACSIRFLTVGETALSAALLKLPSNLDAAARNLGRTHFRASRDVMLPLLHPAILVSLILVFVDTVKELSAAILLRPIGFNTLSTLVYENASRAAVEDGAMAALAIVVVSVATTFLLSRSMADDRS
ncbi:MAG: ABC transporter permease [Rhizobiaceae bacterium]